jgi:hypothetical protein
MSKQENLFYRLDKSILRNLIKYKIQPSWMVRCGPTIHLYVGLPITLLAAVLSIYYLGGLGIVVAFILIASYIPSMLYRITQKKMLDEIEHEKITNNPP